MLQKMKEQIRMLGIQSAIDDYGAGYSNIVNLLRYTPDYVKIDRLLLSGIQDNPQKQHFVRDIAQFAHDNNFYVLAEGVETREQADYLKSIGCERLQGYYFGKAMTLEDAAVKIKAGTLPVSEEFIVNAFSGT